jgi:hypothetical protein
MLMVLYRNILRSHKRGAETELFLSSSHLKALLELGRKAVPESGLDLPGGIRAVVRREFLYMFPAEEISPPDLSALPSDPVVAMAYVPFQQLRSVYGAQDGLKNGTMFPCLNKPFTGKAV